MTNIISCIVVISVFVRVNYLLSWCCGVPEPHHFYQNNLLEYDTEKIIHLGLELPKFYRNNLLFVMNNLLRARLLSV